MALDVIVAGSQISASASAPFPSPPPEMSTRPSRSSVAVWPWRAVMSEPPGLKVPVAGSQISIEARKAEPWVRFPGRRHAAVAAGDQDATIRQQRRGGTLAGDRHPTPSA